MRSKRKLMALMAAGALVLAIGGFVIGGHPAPTAVSLVFQRYSRLDPYLEDGQMAFLALTNASSRSWLLSMTGATNTLLVNNFFGQYHSSWMVNCAFSDQTPDGWSNWVQAPSPYRGSNAYLALAPHSGIVIRVPVPPGGQPRKVAVLYEPVPSRWQQWSFWGSAPGRATLTALIRILPRPAIDRFFGPSAPLEAWCDHELIRPEERHITR